MRFDSRKQRYPDSTTSTGAGPLIARRPGLRDRVNARWQAHRLDLALAGGAPPEVHPAVALRARRLIAPSHRRAIAEALRRVVSESREGAVPSHVRILPSRARVAAASGELGQLADALAQPGPVAARGVARALVLLTDGTGPLFDPGSHGSLQALAVEATEDLRV